VLIERVAAWLGVPALTAPFVLASWAVQMFVQRPDIPANHGDPNVVHPQA
jgi:urea transporter